MKKIMKLFLSFFLFVGLCACGSDLNKEYVGKYELIGMSDGETDYEEDLLKAAGVEFYIELKDDGTVIADLGEGEEEGKWTNEKITIDNDPISYTYEDGVITLTEDEYSMSFRK